jgi:exodeoxyribonuclease VII large subunit
VAIARVLQGLRAHLKAAERGLPRLEDLVALPRQRFDAADKRLSRALLANTRAHAMRQARLATRLNPRLLSVRLERADERLDRLWHHGARCLGRLANERRFRLERAAARLTPRILSQRLGRYRDSFEGCSKLLASLSYHSVLQRGYALVRDATGRTLRSVSGVSTGAVLSVEIADGRFNVQALEGGGAKKRNEQERTLADRGKSAQSVPPGRGSGGGTQGSLF